MDNNTTSPTTPNTAAPAPATPFPASNNAGSNAGNNSISGVGNSANNAGGGTTGDASKAAPATGAKDSGSSKPADAIAAAAPVVERLIKRATDSAHGAVDSMAAKVSSLTDGLQDGVSKVGDTRDEWLDSARDAIREHPFLAVAGGLLIGAALLSLNSSRKD
jgi:hypothetical protein